MQVAMQMVVLHVNFFWIVLTLICGPALLFGLYIAWLVVPTVVKTVVEEVGRAVRSEFGGRRGA